MAAGQAVPGHSSFLQLDTATLTTLKKLYLEEPCTHSFLYNDVFWEPEHTLLYLNTSRRGVEGYLLLASPPEALARREVWGVLWGQVQPLLGLLPLARKTLSLVLVVEDPEPILDLLASAGEVRYSPSLLMERKTMPSDAEGLGELLGSVERVSPEDTAAVAEVAEIYRSVGWLVRATTIRLQAALRPTFLVRGENGDPVATLYICAKAPKTWTFCGLAVHEAYRRQGYAKRLTSFVHGLAWMNGVERTCLIVGEDNIPAINLYRKLGYQTVRKVVMAVYRPEGQTTGQSA